LLPDYWIERPPLSLGDATRSAIDEFLSRPADRQFEVDSVVRENGDVSLWEFLCGIAARREIAFHGTGDPSIESFEPRKPIDFAPFGDQKAVFATSDPIWAMFYAVVDRARFSLTLANGCIMLRDSEDRFGSPHYFFSISRDPLSLQPWRTGHLYFLPAETFVEQPPDMFAGQTARVPQLASPVAVKPFARLQVAPSDFPFLPHIRGHDDDRLAEYAEAVMTAAPWPE
jgi:hypothetical protein